MLTVYGIKNCDTIKKALHWFSENGIDATLYDYRQQGIDAALIATLTALFPWEMLVNKRSTTWRNLDEATKTALSPDTVGELLQANPTLIKRPIVLGAGEPVIGFSEKKYEQIFKGE